MAKYRFRTAAVAAVKESRRDAAVHPVMLLLFGACMAAGKARGEFERALFVKAVWRL